MFGRSYSLGRRDSCARVPRTLVFFLPTYFVWPFVLVFLCLTACDHRSCISLWERASGRTGRPADDVLGQKESFIVNTTATTTYIYIWYLD